MGVPVPDVTGLGMYSYGEARFLNPSRPLAPPTDPVNLAVVGSAWGPQHLPDQMVTLAPTHVAYQDLYASLDADGTPARAMYPGTYMPPVIGALKLGY